MSVTPSIAENCSICTDPLVVTTEPEDGTAEDAVLDDVELRCGHHYHWQCILDHAESDTGCAICATPLYEEEASGSSSDGESTGRFFVTVRNEGGETPDFDLGAELEQQKFMAANPRVARAETFLSLVEQGDADAAEAFLNDDPETGGERVDVNVRKRSTGQTALHLAAYNNDEPGVRMLLTYGADRDARDDAAQTPLECALQVKAEAVVRALTE